MIWSNVLTICLRGGKVAEFNLKNNIYDWPWTNFQTLGLQLKRRFCQAAIRLPKLYHLKQHAIGPVSSPVSGQYQQFLMVLKSVMYVSVLVIVIAVLVT